MMSLTALCDGEGCKQLAQFQSNWSGVAQKRLSEGLIVARFGEHFPTLSACLSGNR